MTIEVRLLVDNFGQIWGEILQKTIDFTQSEEEKLKTYNENNNNLTQVYQHIVLFVPSVLSLKEALPKSFMLFVHACQKSILNIFVRNIAHV